MKRAKSTPENLIIKLIIKKKLSNKSSHQTYYKKNLSPLQILPQRCYKSLKTVISILPKLSLPHGDRISHLGSKAGLRSRQVVRDSESDSESDSEFWPENIDSNSNFASLWPSMRYSILKRAYDVAIVF